MSGIDGGMSIGGAVPGPSGGTGAGEGVADPNAAQTTGAEGTTSSSDPNATQTNYTAPQGDSVGGQGVNPDQVGAVATNVSAVSQAVVVSIAAIVTAVIIFPQ